MDPKDLPVVLQWLTGPGAAYVVGWILSLVVENVPAWAKVSRPIKVILPMLVSMFLSVCATLLLRDAALVNTIGPWWSLIVGAVVAYLGTQQAFINAKKAGYGVRGTKEA